jgi:hypothetical protein
MSSALSFSHVIATFAAIGSIILYSIREAVGQFLHSSAQGTIYHLITGINHGAANNVRVDFAFQFDFTVEAARQSLAHASCLVFIQRMG